MTPTTKNPAAGQEAAQLLASWSYGETFAPEDEHARAVRAAAADYNVEPVSTGTASLLTFLTRTLAARAAVELGTGTGVSGLAILRGLAADGVLTSIDAESVTQQVARKAFAAAGFPNRQARLIAGDCLVVLPKLSDGAYDLVFVDADPLEAVEYIEQAARLIRSGGVLAVYHAFAHGTVAQADAEGDETVIMREVLQAVHDLDEFSPVLLPVGDGLLLATRA